MNYSIINNMKLNFLLCAKGALMKSVHFIFTLLLFLVTTVLLAIGYIGELITSATEKGSKKEKQSATEADAAFEGNNS